jgi:hypothetical protein
MTKTKVVIVEGPDGTGKSTWAKTLAERQQWSYLPPLGPSSPDRLLSHTKAALQPNPGRGRVVDRLILSEIVYSRFYGRPEAPIDWGRLVTWAQKSGVDVSVVLFLRQPPILSPQDQELAPRWDKLLNLYVTVGIPYLFKLGIPFTTVSRWGVEPCWF